MSINKKYTVLILLSFGLMANLGSKAAEDEFQKRYDAQKVANDEAFKEAERRDKDTPNSYTNSQQNQRKRPSAQKLADDTASIQAQRRNKKYKTMPDTKYPNYNPSGRTGNTGETYGEAAGQDLEKVPNEKYKEGSGVK